MRLKYIGQSFDVWVEKDNIYSSNYVIFYPGIPKIHRAPSLDAADSVSKIFGL